MPLFPSPTSKFHDNTYPSLPPRRPKPSAEGKSNLVTGGGTGIGAETARHFAEAGAARVALLGRRKQPLLDTKTSIEQKFPGTSVFVVSADVTKKQQVDDAFDEHAKAEKIDVVVSNAAMTGPIEPVGGVGSEAFMDAIDFNRRGSLYVAQAFLRHASVNATAIEINSSAAHVSFGPGVASYSVAKLAVFRLWDTITVSNPNISVFHVQPGVVDTDMDKAVGGVAAVGHEDHVSLPASFNVWLASPEAQRLARESRSSIPFRGKYLWANWDVNELKTRTEEIRDSEFLSIGLVR
ncbi:Short chain dehydrogenase citE [Fulvia fulva]|uniref:Short chain dehydrogenase citE n=1 Tax=Passalora fulva TaxID=5499 RepID=A0A9Q8LGQ2_PASFU|nr:Short chain dehydrogenase citE [Fulvia fulva]KAK4626890.1 Short chain dehydrogenase citE [Fulvia fulva]UJO17119.1 Short chain dehydrogenase citE [Fulvia fulva]WPV13409.1 Short chain dehydrogenase citE [Fulvia fulva]WPV28548.1 Short chain dehydrogenase citE [Fulvia fulva]